MYFLGPKHQSAIWDRTPPTYTPNIMYMCVGGLRSQNLQTELNYLLFETYCNSSDFLGFLSSVEGGSGSGAGGWGYPG